MAVTLVQSAFRIRGDRSAAQGGTPAWYAAQNSVGVPTQQAAFRIRFQVENTGATDAASNTWQLYASQNSGAYAAVTTSTTFVQGADATNGASANNSAITSALLTGGVTTFVNGQYVSNGVASAQTLPAGDFTEFEFGVILTGSISPGDTYAFRVYYNNTPLNTYSQTPTLLPTTNLPQLKTLSVIYYGANGNFIAQVTNLGPGATPLALTVRGAFFVDGVQQSYGLVTPDPSPMASGAIVNITAASGGGVYVIPGGDHTIGFLADDEHFFTQVSTAFNLLTVPWMVPQPRGSAGIPGTAIIGGGAVPLGYQQISAATLAGATSLTVPTGATIALVQVDTAKVRWRDDGTAPTGAVGNTIEIGGIQSFGGASLSAVQFILATGGSPVLNVSYY